jgi:3-oxoacyl-[acyl-carrier protein] reductase
MLLTPEQRITIMSKLNGKTALVTGASRGIGRATALALASQGAQVLVHYGQAKAEAEAVVAEIQAAGGTAEAFECDVTSSESVTNVVDAVLEKFQRLEILVNNAGITRDTLIPRMADEQWDEVINTNLRGAFLFTRAATRPMMQARYGRIINIASVSGLMGNPGQANYSASKAGVIGFSKTVARELASRGITVNVVAPGFITTDMTNVLPEKIRTEVKERVPVRRLGAPEDIADVVCYLAGAAAGYITGQVIAVDGGMTA